jgi:hypothetical protein
MLTIAKHAMKRAIVRMGRSRALQCRRLLATRASGFVVAHDVVVDHAAVPMAARRIRAKAVPRPAIRDAALVRVDQHVTLVLPGERISPL